MVGGSTHAEDEAVDLSFRYVPGFDTSRWKTLQQ